MDGPTVNTSLKQFADYIRQAALDAGYEVDRINSGAIKRLAAAAGMSQSTVSRLILGERMPRAEYFTGLARALGKDPLELFRESGILPAEERSQTLPEPVASPPITPDDVADAWRLDPFGREMVHALFQRLAEPSADTSDTIESAAQDG
ncbi:helix-turn-helix domain-containing protein [Kitasatospora sp. NBC_01287]|uniref:helix-turn-helix domain-containing protein n=1 Tax=Kitasatospora sp. NBC_01287 TaxID=2903573 RepID=UPI002259B0AF|nr:helix-turn-helix domain-containing protein [Kitasatospora sp. NBC_01287]MCX4751708.1 helix-turn-helix domain-containing protein [Kitasatospora sp. NBC_01287]MCX4752000.1 helix-turn-helix domain-containing protein [Kitasatospora sp. NBC_01287]